MSSSKKKYAISCHKYKHDHGDITDDGVFTISTSEYGRVNDAFDSIDLNEPGQIR